MSRPEFDQAWEMLQAPVKKVIKATDESAVMVTLLRFAAFMHIAMGGDKASFADLSSRCFDRTTKDFNESKN